tara:strand:- start:32 stop:397 length:366 start_codon:yes stop_codon:yes gene_type:complete
MAVTTTTASNPLVTTIVTDTDSDITVETAAGAAQNLYFVEIANTNTVAVYTKLIAAASGSNNSTQHYIQLYCPANTTCYFYVPANVAIASGIQFYTSTAAGVGSQTSPTNDVIVKLGMTAQ